MKNNIQQVKYNENSTIPDKCTWWSWEETCDDCGKIINHFRDIITTNEPDTTEKDYCIRCLYLRLDDVIE